MNRRSFLAALAATGALPVVVRGASISLTGSPQTGSPGGTRLRTSMGIGMYSFSHPQPAAEFLEYCYWLGAGGVQAELSSFEPAYVKKIRQRAEELGMYLEVVASLPQEDAGGFERTVEAAKEAGALCLRAACLDGRRYEEFSTLEGWKNFVATSKARIARALPILEKHRMPLGIENHKDWATEELLALLGEYSSEYLGACVDTGNNLALLDDPMDVVERLAPFAMCTHIKDMAAEEYAEGFLLAEVPLGQGMLDMKRIVNTIGRARPKTKFTLEMITRNPLQIPCLTERYWATFPDRNGKHLARALKLVRSHKSRRALPRLDALDSVARLRLEEENVKQCLEYARGELRLVEQAQVATSQSYATWWPGKLSPK